MRGTTSWTQETRRLQSDVGKKSVRLMARAVSGAPPQLSALSPYWFLFCFVLFLILQTRCCCRDTGTGKFATTSHLVTPPSLLVCMR